MTLLATTIHMYERGKSCIIQDMAASVAQWPYMYNTFVWQTQICEDE